MKELRHLVALLLALAMLMTSALSEELIETLVDITPVAETVEQESVEEPELQPDAESQEETTAVPTEEPAMTPTDEPTAGPTTEPTVEPLPAERLAEELGLTLEELADKLGTDVDTLCQLDEAALRAMLEQVEGSEVAPTEEPSVKPAEAPAEEPSIEPTEEPTTEPTAEPTIEPSEGPGESSIEEIDVTADGEDVPSAESLAAMADGDLDFDTFLALYSDESNHKHQWVVQHGSKANYKYTPSSTTLHMQQASESYSAICSVCGATRTLGTLTIYTGEPHVIADGSCILCGDSNVVVHQPSHTQHIWRYTGGSIMGGISNRGEMGHERNQRKAIGFQCIACSNATAQDSYYFNCIEPHNMSVNGREVSCSECSYSKMLPLTQRIELNLSELPLMLGDMAQLTAVALPEWEYEVERVRWSSSNIDVATVSNTGFVRVVSLGTAEIICEALDDSGVSASCQVTVTPIPLTQSIELNLSEVQLLRGDTTQLMAVVLPELKFDVERVRWSSSNMAAATVSDTGLVRAVGPGTAEIICEALDDSGVSASCQVTVTPRKATAIHFDQAELTMTRVDSATIMATFEPSDVENADVTWASDNEEVATVENGVVSAVDLGVATISCASLLDDSVRASCVVTVMPRQITEMDLPTGESIIYLGEQKNLTDSMSPSDIDRRDVSVVSSDEEVVKVVDGIRVKAVGVGEATITCTSLYDPSISASWTYRVEKSVPITGLVFEPEQLILKPGEKKTVFFRVVPDNATYPETVRCDVMGLMSEYHENWQSRNDSHIWFRPRSCSYPEEGGCLYQFDCRADGEGQESCTFYATDIETGLEYQIGTYQVRATDLFDSLPLALTLSVGESQKFEPSSFRDSTEFTYSSLDRSVAVYKNGKIVAKGEGMTHIKVTDKASQKSATCEVTVVPAPSRLTLNMSSGTLSIGETTPLTATIQPTDALQEVRWKSSDMEIATVDQYGKVTAIAEGKTTITATAKNKTIEGKTLTKKFTLTVVDPKRPTAIRLEQTGTVTLDLEKTLTLNATMEPETAESGLTWTSSDTKIAEVKDGVVTAKKKEGTATITVTTTKKNVKGKKLTATVKIKVVDPQKPRSVMINEGEKSILLYCEAGQTLALTHAVVPESAPQTVTWSIPTDQQKIATIDKDTGVVTPMGEKYGTVTVTAKTTAKKADKKPATATIKVVVADPKVPYSVRIDAQKPVEMKVGEQNTFTATIEPASATKQTKLTWSIPTSSQKYATVNKTTGEVTAKKVGTVTLTVKTGNGKTATIKIKIVKNSTYVRTKGNECPAQ